MKDKNDYIFIFTIGPVQSFIEQARKLHDLYSGSFLLSDLICRAGFLLEKLAGQAKVDIVYPANLQKDTFKPLDKNDQSFPNRIVAVIEDKNEEELRDLGLKLEQQLRCSWEWNAYKQLAKFLRLNETVDRESYEQIEQMSNGAESCKQIFKNSNKISKALVDSCEQQLNSWLEIYWAGKVYKAEEAKSFGEELKSLEEFLAATKNERQIHVLSEEGGRKCSVGGTYNVKFYRAVEEAKAKVPNLFHEDFFLIKENVIENQAVPVRKASRERIHYRYLKEKEGISALTAFKRTYRSFEEGRKSLFQKMGVDRNKDQSFPSTAAIATMNLHAYIEGKDEEGQEPKASKFIKSLWKTIEAENIRDEYDERLFYKEEWLKSEVEEKLFSLELDEPIYDVEVEGENPNSIKAEYPSFIKELGRIEKHKRTKYYALVCFDGDDIGKKLGASKTQEEYHSFSKKLLEFAKLAKSYLDKDGEYRGRTIYAGGDDFIGVVNLEALPAFVCKMQSLFKDVGDYTLSFGICISHYKTPLNEVLKKARAMERTAKTYFTDKKNSTAISWMSSSQVLAETVFSNGHWEEWKKLVGLFMQGKLSTTFVYKFFELSRYFLVDNEDKLMSSSNFKKATIPPLRTELKRLLLAKNSNDDDVASLAKLLPKVMQSYYHKNTLDLETFQFFLKIAVLYQAEVLTVKENK